MAKPDRNLITVINDSLDVDFEDTISREELRKQLAAHVNKLVTKDFNKLLNLLYRLDISEIKLRRMLEENTGTDAGIILADLIIERQLQKLESREHFRKKGENSIDENEKW